MKSEFVGKRLTFYVLFDTMAFVCHGGLKWRNDNEGIVKYIGAIYYSPT